MKAIEPIIERSTTTDSSAVSDLDTVLEEGNELFTYVSLEVDNDSPVSVEHLFSVIKDGRIKVDFESESFLGFYELKGINKPKEKCRFQNKRNCDCEKQWCGCWKIIYLQRK